MVPTLIALGFKADIGVDGVPANVTRMPRSHLRCRRWCASG
jgi:hypothetical protein